MDFHAGMGSKVVRFRRSVGSCLELQGLEPMYVPISHLLYLAVLHIAEYECLFVSPTYEVLESEYPPVPHARRC